MTATCGKETGPDDIPCELPEGHGALLSDKEQAHGYLSGSVFVYWNYQNQNERVVFDGTGGEDERERRILEARMQRVYHSETPDTVVYQREDEIDAAIRAWVKKQDGQSRSFRLWKISDGNAEVVSEGTESSGSTDAPKEK